MKFYTKYEVEIPENIVVEVIKLKRMKRWIHNVNDIQDYISVNLNYKINISDIENIIRYEKERGEKRKK